MVGIKLYLADFTTPSFEPEIQYMKEIIKPKIWKRFAKRHNISAWYNLYIAT